VANHIGEAPQSLQHIGGKLRRKNHVFQAGIALKIRKLYVQRTLQLALKGRKLAHVSPAD
jgi:hypothetical protein